jgi:hypothetical protein
MGDDSRAVFKCLALAKKRWRTMPFSQDDLKDLVRARNLLEHPSMPARISNLIGAPIERGFQMLPAGWADTVAGIARNSLSKALGVAVQSLRPQGRCGSADTMHRVLAAATGAVGGAFGLTALAVELPISTTIMLRSIADIAREEGESLDSMAARLACLEVFALGSRSSADDASEMGYFAVRGIMARTVSEAAQFLTERGLTEKGAPALVRLITQIASRFSTVVTEKVAAQAVPLIGAAGGALINTIFMDHFQNVAHGHFIIRRLERVYGSEAVSRQYQSCGQSTANPPTDSGHSE